MAKPYALAMTTDRVTRTPADAAAHARAHEPEADPRWDGINAADIEPPTRRDPDDPYRIWAEAVADDAAARFAAAIARTT